RARCRPYRHAKLVADDICQRGFAETGRPVKQHVVERFAPLTRGRDGNLEIGANALLADVIVQRPRPKPRLVLRVFIRPRRRDKAIVGRQRANSLKATFSVCSNEPALSDFSAASSAR